MGVEHQADDVTKAEPGSKAPRADRPHPDTLEGARERLAFTYKCNEEDYRASAVLIHKIRLLEIRLDNNGEPIIDAIIDDEHKEWKYGDLEAEISDNADRYPPLALDMLQEKKKTFQETKEVKARERGKASASALRVVEMAHQGGKAEFFHDHNSILYGRVERRDHFEVLAIRDGELAEWIEELCYDAEGLAPEEATSRRVIATLSVLARRGREFQVYLRHGEHDRAFYYDLCDVDWQAVRINRDGWEITDNPPVMFRRYDHMRPQVTPIRPKGKHWALEELLCLTNIGKAGRDVLGIQLHVLMVPGIEQMGGGTLGLEGTGKTTTQRLAVAIADPSTDVESSLPRNKNDLSLHLSTHSLASFDNLTNFSEEQSDDLSRAVTGATDTMRELYSNNRTNRRRYTTPTFFNGIGLTGAKPDFFDRNIIYRTQENFDGPRLSEKRLIARIEELLPYALGEIFENLSKAMGYRAEFTEENRWTPRMVDWYLWALAVAKAMGRPDGWFEHVFRPMVERRDYESIADLPLTRALEYVASQNGYIGTANELYTHLNDPERQIPFNCQIDTRDRKWPTSAGSLGMRIKPLIKSLRSHGVYIYKRQWSHLKKRREALRGLERARCGMTDGIYRDSDDIYVVSDVELDLGRDDDPPVGGK